MNAFMPTVLFHSHCPGRSRLCSRKFSLVFMVKNTINLVMSLRILAERLNFESFEQGCKQQQTFSPKTITQPASFLIAEGYVLCKR